MEGLRETVDAISSALSDAERNRELALAESRRIVRLSKTVIHSIHLGQPHDVESKEMAERMRSLAEGASPDMMLTSPVADAMMEFAEAEILSDVVYGTRIRGFGELGITPHSWIMGMADVIGELRRVIVTDLMNGRCERARRLFSSMEVITGELILFDVPDAILPIRRKQDIARGILEKTRSDLLNAGLPRSL